MRYARRSALRAVLLRALRRGATIPSNTAHFVNNNTFLCLVASTGMEADQEAPAASPFAAQAAAPFSSCVRGDAQAVRRTNGI